MTMEAWLHTAGASPLYLVVARGSTTMGCLARAVLCVVGMRHHTYERCTTCGEWRRPRPARCPHCNG